MKEHRSKLIRSNYLKSSSSMMYEMQLGPKTQLGTYIGNHHSFCFGPLANTSRCQPLHNTHPGLAAMSKCD